MFEIERFDIEQREKGEGTGEDDMDAVTSFELDAQRRREIFEGDAQATRITRAETMDDDVQVARVIAPRVTERRTPAGDCQPAPVG